MSNWSSFTKWRTSLPPIDWESGLGRLKQLRLQKNLFFTGCFVNKYYTAALTYFLTPREKCFLSLWVAFKEARTARIYSLHKYCSIYTSAGDGWWLTSSVHKIWLSRTVHKQCNSKFSIWINHSCHWNTLVNTVKIYAELITNLISALIVGFLSQLTIFRYFGFEIKCFKLFFFDMNSRKYPITACHCLIKWFGAI